MSRWTGGRQGFTIIELIVVIVVIGILAAITVLGLSQYQAKTRDADRAASATVISEALEKYYNNKGEYPSCTAVTGAASTVTGSAGALAGVTVGAIRTPTEASTETNSIKCDDMTTLPGDYYSYVGDGSADCSGSSSCLQYKLQYQEESTDSIKTVYSRHKTPLAAVGTTTGITFPTIGFTMFNTAWTALPNIIEYRIQVSTSNQFTSTVFDGTSATNSRQVTGLSTNTPYYVRVAPMMDGVSGYWSTPAPVTTRQLVVATGTTTVTANSSTQVTVAWVAPSPTPASYQVRFGTTSDLSAETPVTVTGLNRVYTAQLPNDTYYAQVRAVATTPQAYTGPWTTVKSATTPNLNVTGLATTVNSKTSITPDWDAFTSPTPARYEVRYSVNADMSSATTPVNVTPPTVSRAYTGLTPNDTYYFQVRAVLTSPAYTGPWTTAVSATTPDLTVAGLNVTANSATQITASWTATTSPSPSDYTLRYSTSSSMSSPTTITGITGTSRAITGLTPGTTYYVQVRAVLDSGPAYTGPYSASDNATTVVTAPVCSASTLNNNRQITPSWGAVSGASSYTLQYSTSSAFTGATEITGITGTSRAVGSLNNATTYYFRVKTVSGTASSAWDVCPARATGVDGPSSVTWSGRGEAVRASASVGWMPGQYPGGGNWWSVGMYISGTCAPGATVVVRLYAYYAYSNNTSANNAVLLDWTWNAQDLYMVSGNDSWYVWWQGWVACQAGSTRVGDTYLGNAGPY